MEWMWDIKKKEGGMKIMILSKWMDSETIYWFAES